MSEAPAIQPDVSVLMSVRNASGTVEKAVRSVLDQRLKEGKLDLIVVDDQSSDRSDAIVEAISREDPRITLLRSEHPGGLVPAHQMGLRAARSPLVARMDADDHVLPDWLECQLGFLKDHPEVDVCGCLARAGSPLGEGMIRYVEWTNQLRNHEDIAAARFIESPIVHPGSVIRRAALDSVGLYREVDWAEDYDLWLRLLEAGFRFAKNPAELLIWNDSPDRLTRADDRYSHESFLRAKAHFLGKMEPVRRMGIAICGAGPIGKRMGRFLQKEGVEVRAYFEVSERRIGEKINRVQVIGHENFPGEHRAGQVILLGAVGTPGARERIQSIARDAGFIEGSDFFCVA